LSLLLQKKEVVSQEAANAQDLLQNDEVRMMKLECLDAARNNCKILLDLSKCNKIGKFRWLGLSIFDHESGYDADKTTAKFGYWDSVHLFSALAILSLFKVIGVYSDPFQEDEDATLYKLCRAELEDMAQAGNPSARDYEPLLKDVEGFIHEASSQSTTQTDEYGAGNQVWDPQLSWSNTGLDELMIDQPWYDVDWRSLLDGYNWGP
jgi:proline utilization trans-activator